MTRADRSCDTPAPPFLIARHTPPPALGGAIAALTTYAERGEPAAMREAAPLRVPVIVSLGTPFDIALGRDPSREDRRHSFAAGLWPGPVHIHSDGGAECVQADLHPLAAFRLFGGAVTALAGAMVPMDDLFGRAGAALVERCGNAPAGERATVLADFIARRLGPAPSAATSFAWDRLARSGGRARVDAIAADLGISRTLLSTRFRAEMGVPPKTVARLFRFARARRLALDRVSWAAIAADAGYADQAHLVREFVALAGEPPTAWARRVAAAPWLDREG